MQVFLVEAVYGVDSFQRKLFLVRKNAEDFFTELIKEFEPNADLEQILKKGTINNGEISFNNGEISFFLEELSTEEE